MAIEFLSKLRHKPQSLFASLETTSLRFRLSLWHVVFTFICMSCYGAVLSQYLHYELRASREQNMLLREHRFVAFVNDGMEHGPGTNLALEIQHFAEASPDSDLIEIVSLEGARLYPASPNGPNLPLPHAGQNCPFACLSTYDRDGHHWRLLTHQTTLAGSTVWLLMAGVTDEHDSILRSVRTGYFVLLPLVLLGSVIGGYGMSRRALQPVGLLTATAQRLSLKALDGRLPVPQTGDELQSLAEAWNDLLVRLESEVNRSTRFTMDISHDLRSAMTVILSNAELALRRQRQPESYCLTLTTIQHEATHIMVMLEDVLLAAQSTSVSQSMSKAPVPLGELVAEVYASSCAAAQIKQQTLRFEQHQHDELWVLGDRSLLRRMISSLVDNALKYTPPGGLIEIYTKEHDGSFLVQVCDNGIGIAPELQHRIFDRLFRADAARSRQESSGSGLGLSIVKWIAEAHGFQVSLHSQVHQGSTFSILVSRDLNVLVNQPLRVG